VCVVRKARTMTDALIAHARDNALLDAPMVFALHAHLMVTSVLTAQGVTRVCNRAKHRT
jgi:hypothetical protein